MSQNAAEKNSRSQEAESNTPKESTDKIEQKRSSKLGETLASISKAKKDPFKEAAEAEFKDPDSTKAEFEEIKSEPIPLKNKNKRNASSGQKTKTSFVGVLGLLVALFALGWNYYQDRTLNNYKASVTNELESRDSSIAGLTTRMDEVKANSNKVTRAVEKNAKALSQLEQVPQKVNRVATVLEELRSEVVELASRVESNSKAIKENNETTEELKNYIDMLSKRQVKPTKIGSVKSETKSYTIGHAVLASIDKWGDEINAVLKSDSGWIPLGVGDLYQGWKLVGADGDEAIFKKGKKELRLSIQE